MWYINKVSASTAIIIIMLFYVLKYIINKFREYNMAKKFSGPKAYPLIGNLNMFFGDVKDITGNLIKMFSDYSSPCRLWLGLTLMVFFDDPENIKILSNSSNGYEKSSVYDFMKFSLGNGLFTAPASIWKNHRRILNPVFKENMVSTYVDSIVKNANRLTNILETTNGKNVNFLHYVHLCMLDIIYDSLLESDLNLQSNPDCRYDEYMSKGIDITIQRVMKLWLHPNIIFKNSSMGKWIKEHHSILNEITNEIIKKKKESMHKDNFTWEEKEKDTSPFLDAIFKSFYETGEYSEADIRDEINTLVFAGSDTAANTLSFLFLMLATFPDIQNQVYEELYDLYGSSDPIDFPITMEDTRKMKYLDRVIKETLRLFPVGPFIARKLSRDTKVNNNVIIPKNCHVVISIFSLHRKDKYWTDPLRFNPDRFFPGNYNEKCFRPFSFGNRGCIGQIFAMTKMKVITASILRKFTVRIDNPVSVENVNLKFRIPLQPEKPIFLRFNER
ncbi:cytochrome P450 4C1-like isoform X2 [Polistes fuscatus]|uniref:cytochrome P450 4C1-like isoform X2 n=1 Tax=Polistes fuscatus TaxID=30207 RepID=UPI001CA8C29A|nr:cytochrome P450 4C1-like isoform X2 [Polistes fuscatus]